MSTSNMNDFPHSALYVDKLGTKSKTMEKWTEKMKLNEIRRKNYHMCNA